MSTALTMFTLQAVHDGNLLSKALKAKLVCSANNKPWSHCGFISAERRAPGLQSSSNIRHM
jgi:hypothetical protein